MHTIPSPLPYTLTLVKTEAATGFFACLPPEEMTLEQCLNYVETHPNDVFMRQHVLQQIGTWEPTRIHDVLREYERRESPLVFVFHEAVFLSARFRKIRKTLNRERLKRSAEHSPLIHLRAMLLPDHALHKRWIKLFRANMLEHKPLPAPKEARLPFPCKAAPVKQETPLPDIKTLRKTIIAGPLPATQPRAAPEETARIGLERLEQLDVVHGPLQRHEATLSPIALLRQWRLDIRVQSGRHDYTLAGAQTAYGRGLALEHAMASYVMEMVERKSSFASVTKTHVEGCLREHRLAHGRFSTLSKGETAVLDPNVLALEVPYQDEPLHWITGERISVNGPEPILVPAQCVFLFCNLDERNLFSGLGSTGLAAGNTLEEAKVSALLEIIERDHESVTPFDPRQCFTVETRDPLLACLLQSYQEQGICLQFQDLTSSMGVPCCKCFVIDQNQQIVKGCGAGLSAKRALLSAMTETPFPFPAGSCSAPGLEGLLRVPVENLPDYSTGNTAADLALLEGVLAAHGFQPVYVDLTREDINLPVVRAMVPGMEITADFDWYSRVHPRLFSNYLKMMKL